MVSKANKKVLEEKARSYAISTLISRYYPEYEAIMKKRLEILIKINSQKKGAKNNG